MGLLVDVGDTLIGAESMAASHIKPTSSGIFDVTDLGSTSSASGPTETDSGPWQNLIRTNST